jgi:hypothetical protein
MQIILYVRKCLSKYGDGCFKRNLIETPLYKNLNVSIHHQWASLFALHMNSKYQILTYNNASSDNSDFDNEKIHYTPTNSMIRNFLDAPKIMDYENIIYFITPNQNFHPLGFTLKLTFRRTKFSSIVLWQPR